MASELKGDQIRAAYGLERSPRYDPRELLRENAHQALAGLEPGTDILGLTKGQFSCIDLIDAALALTGPARVLISTWTAGEADFQKIAQWCSSGRIEAVQWLLDYSFPRRHGAYAAELRRLFGDECIRVTANHAKFSIIRGGGRSIVIRTTMNLNRNMRLENFEASDDEALADFFETVSASVFELQDLGAWIDENPYERKAEFKGLGKRSARIEELEQFGCILDDPMSPGFEVLS